MMNILLMANWGMGVEILKALHRHRMVDTIITVSRYAAQSRDLWENALYHHSNELGYDTFPEQDITFTEILKKINYHHIDLMITHAFMRILPGYVFSAPKMGTINIHTSLLPKYRGPSPTPWVLKNREPETGLTCHFIDEGMDTGDIIHQVKFSVEKKDTVESIIEKGKLRLEQLIHESLTKLIDESFTPLKQIEKHATYAPRIERCI